MNNATIEPGQRWTYRTRPGEETSTAVVLRVDAYAEQGRIVSVRLDGLLMPNADSPDGYTREIGHVPVLEEKFRQSVLEVVEVLRPVPHEAGYDQWRAAFDAGEAGAFDLTLAEIVEAMAYALAQAAPRNVFEKSPFGR